MDDFDYSEWCGGMLAPDGAEGVEDREAGSESTGHSGDGDRPPPPLPSQQNVLEVIDLEEDASVGAGAPLNGAEEPASSPGGPTDGVVPPDEAQDSPPWAKDRYYAQWAKHIDCAPLKDLQNLKGPFLRPPRMASLFNGLSSEKKVMQLFGVEAEWCFSCDKKPSTVAWQHQHFPRSTHHFVDGLDFLDAEEGGGRDLYSEGLGRVKLSKFHKLIDVLFVGTSCRPFSSSRSGRKSKGTSHEDVKLLDSFFHVARETEPAAMIFEQVYGFAMPERTGDPESPLQKFLQRCKDDLPQYEVSTYFAEGGLFLVLARHRVYIILVHNDHGGRGSLDVLTAIVKAEQNLHQR